MPTQTFLGPLTCPVCGHTDPEAAASAPMPLGPLGPPLEVRVGEPLGVPVPAYAAELDHLRPAADPARATAIVAWECPTCVAERWAIARLGAEDGAPVLAGLEAVPVAPETLRRADWISGAILARRMFGTEDHGRWPSPGRLVDPELLARVASRLDTDEEHT
jgi:hypothetical protein